MEKIGILGGSFDPIHKGHLEIIRSLFNDYHVKEVWLLISYQKQNPTRAITSSTKRKKMIKASLEEEGLTKVKLCNNELKKEKFVQTFTSLKELKKEHPKKEFLFAFGSDHVPGFSKWKNIAKVGKYSQMVCYPRKTKPILFEFTSLLLDFNCLVAQIAIPNVSSSDIRKGQKLHLLSSSVLEYLHNNNLYTEGWAKFHINDDKKFAHCLRVAKKMRKLASIHDIDKQEAYVAGLFHDIGKNWEKSKATKYLEEKGVEFDELHPNLWHQFIAAYVTRDELKYSSKDIFSAISKHTSASKNMSKLDKLLFTVDKMDAEPFMNSLSKKEAVALKKIVLVSIDNAFLFVLSRGIQYLESQNNPDMIDEIIKLRKLRASFMRKEFRSGS